MVGIGEIPVEVKQRRHGDINGKNHIWFNEYLRRLCSELGHVRGTGLMTSGIVLIVINPVPLTPQLVIMDNGRIKHN